MNREMMDALREIANDKGISEDVMLQALADALVTAYKRMPNAAEEALVEIDTETGEIRVIAQELDEDGHVVREWDDTPDDFGRIAAQTAKQVILQRIREAEREMKFEQYTGREGEIVTGIIQQSDQRYTLLDLGPVEGSVESLVVGHRPVVVPEFRLHVMQQAQRLDEGIATGLAPADRILHVGDRDDRAAWGGGCILCVRACSENR